MRFGLATVTINHIIMKCKCSIANKLSPNQGLCFQVVLKDSTLKCFRSQSMLDASQEVWAVKPRFVDLCTNTEISTTGCHQEEANQMCLPEGGRGQKSYEAKKWEDPA